MQAPTTGQWMRDKSGEPYCYIEEVVATPSGFTVLLVEKLPAEVPDSTPIEMDQDAFAAYCAQHGIAAN